MKTKLSTLFGWIGLLVVVVMIAGCASPAPAAQTANQGQTAETETIDLAPVAPQVEETRVTPALLEFSLPEGISFQLPQGYDWWGNAGWLSNDGGSSFIGLRQAWIVEGQDAARHLFNEDVLILSESDRLVGEIAAHVYTIESYLTVAATGERKLAGYERIYAFPASDEVMAGVFTQAQSVEALDALDEAAQTMIASLRWPE
jgi:hypothetical protein